LQKYKQISQSGAYGTRKERNAEFFSKDNSTPSICTQIHSIQHFNTMALISDKPVSQLLFEHSSDIEALKEEAKSIVESVDLEPYNQDVFYLRFCLRTKKLPEQLEFLRNNLKWRMNEGKAICDAAHDAVILATAEGRWNNAPVLERAPSGDKIAKYLTAEVCLTSTTSKGDLVYCLRSGRIDDVAMMSEVTVQEMTDFLVYAKEINARICNRRSLVQDRVVATIFANDLSGAKIMGGSSEFREALGASGKIAEDNYPRMAGPTLMLNMPKALHYVVKLFTPLMPTSVAKKIKFVRGLFDDQTVLAEIQPGGSQREKFLADLDKIVY
jgi:hypothetical protein